MAQRPSFNLRKIVFKLHSFSLPRLRKFKKDTPQLVTSHLFLLFLKRSLLAITVKESIVYTCLKAK